MRSMSGDPAVLGMGLKLRVDPPVRYLDKANLRGRDDPSLWPVSPISNEDETLEA
jgi:hypothetical protein